MHPTTPRTASCDPVNGPDRWSRHEWLALVLGLLTMLAIHLGSSVLRGRLGDTLSGHDEQLYYAHLRSMMVDGDFDYANELTELTPEPWPKERVKRTPTGKGLNKSSLGWAVVSLGPYAAVHAVAVGLHQAGLGPSTTGYEPPYQLAASLAQLVGGWLGVVLTVSLVRRRVGPRVAFATVTLIVVGSPLLFYTTCSLFMAHASSFLAVSALVWASDTLDRAWRQGEPGRRRIWALLGFSASLMVMVRYSNIVFTVVPVLLLIAALWDRKVAGRVKTDLLRRLLIALLAALPLACLQLMYWRIAFGSWIAYSYGDEGFSWLDPALFGYLFSHRHGVFFFAPVLLPASIGLVVTAWRCSGNTRDRLALTGLVAVGLLTYLNASWWCWWFGDAFGARSFIAASPFLAIGLGRLFARLRRTGRWALCTLCVAGAAWTCCLLVLQYLDRIADDGSTTLIEILQILSGLV